MYVFFRLIANSLAILILLTFPLSAQESVTIGESDDSAAEKQDGIGQSAAASRPDARPELIAPFAKNKRRAAIAGNAIFFSGALIEYGLILPKSLTLGPYDTEDQLALLSPSLLASGLRYAGPPMACMRTSEVANYYERYMNTEAPRNISWTLYFCGWGLTAVAGGLNGAAYVIDEDYIKYGAIGVGIAADVAWAATCIYSLVWLNKTGQAAEAARVSFAPIANTNGDAGLAMRIKF